MRSEGAEGGGKGTSCEGRGGGIVGKGGWEGIEGESDVRSGNGRGGGGIEEGELGRRVWPSEKGLQEEMG